VPVRCIGAVLAMAAVGADAQAGGSPIHDGPNCVSPCNFRPFGCGALEPSNARSLRYRVLKRFVGGKLEEFQRFFAADFEFVVEEARYPPCCFAESGPLRFRPARAGAIILQVKRCWVERTGDFRLDMLFSTGASVFTDAIDLAQFWNGPLADAFGAARGPIPERPALAPPPDVQSRDQAPAAKPSHSDSSSNPRRGRRVPTAADLVRALERSVTGQTPALQVLASLVISQLAKRAAARPATALLLGPTGVGKTSSIEALPGALAETGWSGTFIHRIDCNELTDDYDVHRFLGSAPGLVGYTTEPPLVAALRKPGCIVLLDEIDKAHPAVQEAFYALLDSGRIMAPTSEEVRSPETIVLMTSAAGADELESRLHKVERSNLLATSSVARGHLRAEGWRGELLSRIGAIAVYQPLEHEARRQAALHAIHRLGEEYGFAVATVEPVLADVVMDIAQDGDLGARGLYYAARQLLGEAFAAATVEVEAGVVDVVAGPPPNVAPAGQAALPISDG
jgi:MoxR-like ATPase